MSHRIGYLWDSLSANTGDQAIGSTLLRLARRAGLGALSPVRIGEPIANAYDLLVIGGGELLQPPGNPYYDLFRVPGEHVLNTVGTSGQVEASHLRSYRLVSVRSQADRRHLAGPALDVRVAPCLSLLFSEVAQGGSPCPPRPGTIGLHLQPATLAQGSARALAEVVRRHLHDPVALVPFTPYNLDAFVQSAFARAAELPPPLAVAGPDQAFDVIRRLDALVTTSLHATIFAYSAGVPFLAVPYAPKVRHFLDDRGLSQRLLPSLLDLPDRLALLAKDSVDWQAPLAADRQAARRLAEEIFATVEDALTSAPGAGRRFLDAWREPTHACAAHAVLIERHAEYGRRIAERIEREAEIARAAEHVATVERQLAAVERNQREVDGYVASLLASLEDTQRELAKAGPYAAALQQRVAALEGERTALQQRVAGLGEQTAALISRKALLEEELGQRRVPRICAVTVHQGGRDLLDHCLAGLLRSRGARVDVVVVANACREALPEAAANEASIHVVRSEVSLGFSDANNLGVAWAREHLGEPDHWFFVNNDAAVQTDTLRRLAEALEAAPRGGIAGPRLVIWGAEEHLNSLGLNVTRIGEAWDEGIGVPIAEYGPLPGRREVLAVTGSALLIRAQTFQEIGGWSGIYGYYLEDVDLCLKARSRGWTVVHVPDAVAAHAISATADQIADFKRFFSWRNQLLLILIHWPLRSLLRAAPRLLAGQLRVFLLRLRRRCYADARLQARAWAGALRRLPQALAQRSHGDGGWVRLLRPPGSVPVIRLPAPLPGPPWQPRTRSLP